MKKSWGILLIAILLAIIAWCVWRPFHPRGKPTILGNLSEGEVVAIKWAVTKDMRGRVFPKFTWRNFKDLPANYMAYFKNDITRIEEMSPSAAVVGVGDFSQPELNREDFLYVVLRGSNGWKIDHIIIHLWPGQQVSPGTNYSAPPPIPRLATGSQAEGANFGAVPKEIIASSHLTLDPNASQTNADTLFQSHPPMSDKKDFDISLKPADFGAHVKVKYYGLTFPGNSDVSLKSLVPTNANSH